MKTKHFFGLVTIAFLLTNGSFAQQLAANENTFIVSVDGKEFKTQPRRIKIGSIWYITANAAKPDKSLRFWFVNWSGAETPMVGVYKIVPERYNPSRAETEALVGKYKGYAYMKYVEETREPRMEYHVGEPRREDAGEIEITASSDQGMEAKFSVKLDGTYWKERASATVFGGIGRLKDKLVDKAVTNATGYDQDIDPEGRGYRRQDQKDEIVMTNGKWTLKLAKDQK